MVSCNLAASSVEVGATVKVETVNGMTVEGIVISFDVLKKILIVDAKETTATKPVIRIFNSEHLKNITVTSKANEDSVKHSKDKTKHFANTNPVNGTKTSERLKKTLEELRPTFMKSSGISIRGQQAYIQLKRTIADTCWSGEDIRVLKLVLVQKPYDVANVIKDAKATGFDESRADSAVLQVQKILSKPSTEQSARVPLDFTIGAVTAN